MQGPVGTPLDFIQQQHASLVVCDISRIKPPVAESTELTAHCPIHKNCIHSGCAEEGREEEWWAEGRETGVNRSALQQGAKIPGRTISFLVPMGSLMKGCSCVGRGCRAGLGESAD